MDIRRSLLAAALSGVTVICLAGCVLTPAVSSVFYRDGPTTTPEPRNFTGAPKPKRTPTPPAAPNNSDEPDADSEGFTQQDDRSLPNQRAPHIGGDEPTEVAE